MSTAADERKKMYIISRIVLHPTELVTANFENMIIFAKETKGQTYEDRLDKLKELRGYYKAWDTWLQLVYCLDSLHSKGKYDARFISEATIKRVDEKIEQEWSERWLK